MGGGVAITLHLNCFIFQHSYATNYDWKMLSEINMFDLISAYPRIIGSTHSCVSLHTLLTIVDTG